MIDVYYLKNENLICLPNEFEASLPLHLKEKLENIKHAKTALQKRKLLFRMFKGTIPKQYRYMGSLFSAFHITDDTRQPG